MTEKYQKGWRQFIELCTEMENAGKLETLFELFLTPQEKESLAMRYLIIRDLLEEKQTQREIAEDLSVSIAKITRGSNELKRIPSGFIKYLKTKL